MRQQLLSVTVIKKLGFWLVVGFLFVFLERHFAFLRHHSTFLLLGITILTLVVNHLFPHWGILNSTGSFVDSGSESGNTTDCSGGGGAGGDCGGGD